MLESLRGCLVMLSVVFGFGLLACGPIRNYQMWLLAHTGNEARLLHIIGQDSTSYVVRGLADSTLTGLALLLAVAGAFAGQSGSRLRLIAFGLALISLCLGLPTHVPILSVCEGDTITSLLQYFPLCMFAHPIVLVGIKGASLLVIGVFAWKELSAFASPER